MTKAAPPRPRSLASARPTSAVVASAYNADDVVQAKAVAEAHAETQALQAAEPRRRATAFGARAASCVPCDVNAAKASPLHTPVARARAGGRRAPEAAAGEHASGRNHEARFVSAISAWYAAPPIPSRRAASARARQLREASRLNIDEAAPRPCPRRAPASRDEAAGGAVGGADAVAIAGSRARARFEDGHCGTPWSAWNDRASPPPPSRASSILPQPRTHTDAPKRAPKRYWAEGAGAVARGRGAEPAATTTADGRGAPRRVGIRSGGASGNRRPRAP